MWIVSGRWIKGGCSLSRGPSVSDFGSRVTWSGYGPTVTGCFRFCSSGHAMVQTSERAFN